MPLVGQLPVCELEGLPIRRFDPKALFAGTPPTCENLCYLQPLSLPDQRQRAIGKLGIGAALNNFHGTAFCNTILAVSIQKA
jgi:hypothetical protein